MGLTSLQNCEQPGMGLRHNILLFHLDQAVNRALNYDWGCKQGTELWQAVNRALNYDWGCKQGTELGLRL